MMRRTLRGASVLALASGVAIAILIPDAPLGRSVTYGPGIPSATDNRLGLRLAILAMALVASAILLAASREAKASS
jgi:hypothetical protein